MFDSANKSSNVLPEISDEPLESQGSNIKTCGLKRLSDNRIELQIAWPMKTLSLTFLLGGMLTIVLFLADILIASITVENSWIAPLIGAPLIIIGIKGLLTRCIGGFDKELGYYWKGKGHIHSIEEITQQNEHGALSDIISVQLLEAIDSMDDWQYYELNLVLSNGERINIMRHTGKNIQSEAYMLSTFLNIPLVTP